MPPPKNPSNEKKKSWDPSPPQTTSKPANDHPPKRITQVRPWSTLKQSSSTSELQGSSGRPSVSSGSLHINRGPLPINNGGKASKELLCISHLLHPFTSFYQLLFGVPMSEPCPYLVSFTKGPTISRVFHGFSVFSTEAPSLVIFCLFFERHTRETHLKYQPKQTLWICR